MEQNVRRLPAQILMERILLLLEDTEQVPMVISGSSMSPFLIHGRDTVYFSKISAPLKRGDIILYRRDSGAYVVHRICRVKKDSFHLIGDAQTEIEKGIRPEQALAIVTAVRRKGVILKKGSFWWDFFEKVWLNLIPFRPLIASVYAFLAGGRNREN